MKFIKLDVRPLIAKGLPPLPEILQRVEALKPDQGLTVVAPFLPAPLIERLKGEGFASKFEPKPPGAWTVRFWRESPADNSR